MTVTDDRGGKDTATKTVTVAPHAAPEAAFTSTVNDLSASFDADGSDDADGSIESYAWDFGDGETGTGKTATHVYDEAGSYDVTLTVTDDDGLEESVTHQVTVKAPAVFAEDDFGRSVSSGWGAADRGGNWSISTGACRFSVADGVGKVQLNAGNGYTALLNDVSSVGHRSEGRRHASTSRRPSGGQYVR